MLLTFLLHLSHLLRNIQFFYLCIFLLQQSFNPEPLAMRPLRWLTKGSLQLASFLEIVLDRANSVRGEESFCSKTIDLTGRRI